MYFACGGDAHLGVQKVDCDRIQKRAPNSHHLVNCIIPPSRVYTGWGRAVNMVGVACN